MLSVEIFKTHHKRVSDRFATKNGRVPSTDELRLEYFGSRTLAGYRELFSDETWIELCDLAILECTFMPEASWFRKRAEALTQREVESSGGLPLMLVGAEVVPATAAEILAAKAKAKARQDAEARDLRLAQSKLFKTVKGVPQPIAPFLEWVRSNRYRLYDYLSIAARRGVYCMTEDSKIESYLCRNLRIQQAFIESRSTGSTPLDDYLSELNRRVREQARSLAGTSRSLELEGF
ncbi:MAG: hypothetical protein ACRCT2_01860 [Plesiomonas shigelloides]